MVKRTRFLPAGNLRSFDLRKQALLEDGPNPTPRRTLLGGGGGSWSSERDIFCATRAERVRGEKVSKNLRRLVIMLLFVCTRSSCCFGYNYLSFICRTTLYIYYYKHVL